MYIEWASALVQPTPFIFFRIFSRSSQANLPEVHMSRHRSLGKNIPQKNTRNKLLKSSLDRILSTRHVEPSTKHPREGGLLKATDFLDLKWTKLKEKVGS